MIVNYIGSIDNRHEVSEYTLSTGTKLVISKEEVEEFVFNIHMLEVIEMHIDTYNELLEIKEPNG